MGWFIKTPQEKYDKLIAEFKRLVKQIQVQQQAALGALNNTKNAAAAFAAAGREVRTAQGLINNARGAARQIETLCKSQHWEIPAPVQSLLAEEAMEERRERALRTGLKQRGARV